MKTDQVANPKTGFKLFHLRKDGTLGPLFIDQKLRIPIGEWLEARHDTKPPKPTWKVRHGWHICHKPLAPHLHGTSQNRVWAKVAYFDHEPIPRPDRMGGDWVLAQHIKVLGILDPIQVRLENVDVKLARYSSEIRDAVRSEMILQDILGG